MKAVRTALGPEGALAGLVFGGIEVKLESYHTSFSSSTGSLGEDLSTGGR